MRIKIIHVFFCRLNSRFTSKNLYSVYSFFYVFYVGVLPCRVSAINNINGLHYILKSYFAFDHFLFTFRREVITHQSSHYGTKKC